MQRIDPNQYLFPIILLLQSTNHSFMVIIIDIISDNAGFHRQMSHSDHDIPPVELESQVAPWSAHVVDAQSALAAGDKVTGVFEGVEADNIAAEHSMQQGISVGKYAIHLGTGKRHMQVKPNIECFSSSAADEAGQQQELVVVHPDDFSVVVQFNDLVSEARVDVGVGFPELVAVLRDGVRVGFDDVMEETEKDTIAEKDVLLKQILRDKERHTVVVFKQNSA
jgi:hypothetical protein